VKITELEIADHQLRMQVESLTPQERTELLAKLRQPAKLASAQ
jgi:hypothetical protein